MNQIFRSLQNSNRAFALTSDSPSNYDFYRNPCAYLGNYACWFETFGDGLTQHSPFYQCTVEHFTDFCLSVAQWLVENPTADLHGHYLEAVQVLPETYAFLQKIKYDEKKTRFYCIGNSEITTKTDKRYDTRYSEVPTWADGSTQSCIRLFADTNDKKFRSILNRYWIADEFTRLAKIDLYLGKQWNEFREALPECHDMAFDAMRAMIEANFARRLTIQRIDNTTQYWKNQAEEKAALAAQQAPLPATGAEAA